MGHILDIKMVKAGMKVAEDIVDPKNDNKLVASGTPLTDGYIKILIARGFDQIPISFTEKEKLRYEMDQTVLGTVSDVIMKKASEAVKSIDGKRPINEQTIRDVIGSASSIVDSVLVDQKFTYKLTDYKLNREPSEHAVRVAAYAVAMVNKYNKRIDEMPNLKLDERNKRKINLESVAIAALLHDVGKTCEDDEIRGALHETAYLTSNFPGITKENIPELQKNYNPEYVPYYGFNVIHNNRDLPSDSKVMVLLSGETNNSGPLQAYKKNSSTKFLDAAKIINFCSYFDEILMDNIKEEVTLENAFSALQGLISSNQFDSKLLTDFIETIPLYPVGTKVKMHGELNGYGVVKDNFQTVVDYTRPLLTSVPDKKDIDLRETTTTTIKQVIGNEISFSKFFIEKILEDDELEKNGGTR